MAVEHPRTTAQQAVVQQAEQHTYLSNSGELSVSDATVQLVMAALDAFTAGLSREEIVRALTDGEQQGATLYLNVLKSGQDVSYWKAVREEAETFWENRSSYGDGSPDERGKSL